MTRDSSSTDGGRLAGKTAIVTGGERGIGKAIASGLAREGAKVALLHYPLRADLAQHTVDALKESGASACGLPCDISIPGQVTEALDRALQFLGGFDILVNNAATLVREELFQITFESFSRVIDTNLKGTFLVSQMVADQMMRAGAGGSIINVASVSAERAAPGLIHYQAAKAGVVMLTKGMALELAPHQIRVNAISPGLTVTDLNRDLMDNPVTRAERTATVPLGRPGMPEDHVGAAVFLASDESSWITGSTITVDGGITVR